LTQAGVLLGTVGYMSPEQARGEAVGPPSDVFAFGCILYEALTGRRAFAGHTEGDVLQQIRSGEPVPLERLSPRTPGPVRRLVARCLAKDPGERYASGQELARAVQDCIRVVSRAPLWRVVAPLALLLAALIIGISVGRSGVDPGPPSAGPRMTAPRITRLTNTGRVRAATVSPDGKYVAFVSVEAKGQCIWLQQVGASGAARIVPAGPSSLLAPTFSPDGRHLFFVGVAPGTRVGVLYRIPLLGGTPREVLRDVDSNPAFSPDGARLAFHRFYDDTGRSVLLVASADGAGERAIAERRVPAQYGAWISWSPDGRRLAALARSPGLRNTIAVVDPATGREHAVTQDTWALVFGLTWTPDGSGLLLAGRRHAGGASRIWRVAYPSGTSDVLLQDPVNYASITVASDGSQLAAVQGDSITSLWVAPAGDPGQARQISVGSGGYQRVAWMPDGRLLYTSRESGRFDVWAVDPRGGEPRQLTAESGTNMSAQATPDGTHIVFVSDREGGFALWRMRSDGTDVRRLTAGPSDSLPCVTADGRWVVFQRFIGNTPSLWKVSIEGGEAVRVTRGAATDPALAPDGTLAFLRWRGEGERLRWFVMVRPMEGGRAREAFEVPPGAGLLSFVPGDRALSYVAGRGRSRNVLVRPLAGGPPRAVTGFRSKTIRSYAWSRDGKEIACVRATAVADVVLVTGLPLLGAARAR
jgi:Tol biopolymer transport system component